MSNEMRGVNSKARYGALEVAVVKDGSSDVVTALKALGLGGVAAIKDDLGALLLG